MKRRITTVAISIIIMISLFTSCDGTDIITTSQENIILNVALYNYVPDLERFKQVVETEWQKVEPNIKLNFVEWDCYESMPSDNLDVFVFDSIYLKDFFNGGYLLPLSENDINNKEDILDYALAGCKIDSSYYGIPQIMCTNLLFYRKDDDEIAQQNTVRGLYDVIGDRKTSDVIPEPGEGLLIDMSGGTTKSCQYIDTFVDHSQVYNGYYQLTETPNFNTEAMDYLKLLVKMGGKSQVEYYSDDEPYIRADWFKNGHGRASIGYAESMAVMGDFINEIDFKLFSLCEHNNIPLFYCDIVSINSKIGDKKDAAIKLANVITAAETMITAVATNEINKYPQYLLPARNSVYEELAKDFKVYEKLHKIVKIDNGELFLISPNVNDWISTNKGRLKEVLFS